MRELFARLTARPVLLLELLAATLCVTVLNLASPLFVIQVLNRYVTFGFDGTLVTLFAGLCIALVMLLGFRTVLTRLAAAVSAEPDDRLQARTLTMLARMRSGQLDRIGKGPVQELLADIPTVQQAYDAPNITAALEAPFSLLYILTAFLLSPILGFIGLAGCVITLLASSMTLHGAKRLSKDLQDIAGAHRAQTGAALHGADTVRAFGGWPYLRRIWEQQIARMGELRQAVARNRGFFGSIVQVDMMFLSGVLYAIGAVQVVQGDLTVGALIGVNILTARAFQSLTRFSQSWFLMSRAKDSLRRLEEFHELPQEPDAGATLGNYRGALQFKDVGFAFPGATGPLFESLSLSLAPGDVIIVSGPNGSGKTTLMRVAAGLVEPGRGDILVDGVNMRQLSQPWWRSQLIYLPQEPTFLNATMRENILMANPELDHEELARVVAQANLDPFLHGSPAGLDTPVTDGGRTLPLGIRRRLALARALATDGPLVLFDEPTEGLDQEGCKAVYLLLNQLAKAGKTIIAVSHDPHILRGASTILDMGVKPSPALRRARPVAQAKAKAPTGGAA